MWIALFVALFLFDPFCVISRRTSEQQQIDSQHTLSLTPTTPTHNSQLTHALFHYLSFISLFHFFTLVLLRTRYFVPKDPSKGIEQSFQQLLTMRQDIVNLSHKADLEEVNVEE
jgi:hypothetical protein